MRQRYHSMTELRDMSFTVELEIEGSGVQEIGKGSPQDMVFVTGI